MTFKERYKQSMDSVNPSDSFEQRLLERLTGDNIASEEIPTARGASGRRNQRRTAALLLSAACLLLIIGLSAVFLNGMPTASAKMNEKKTADTADPDMCYAPEEETAEETEETEAAGVTGENGMTENEEFGYITFSAGEEAAEGIWDNNAFSAFVDEKDASVLILTADAEKLSSCVYSPGEMADAPVFQQVSLTQEQVQAFADLLCFAEDCRTVDAENPSDFFDGETEAVLQMKLALADGSELWMIASQSGTVLIPSESLMILPGDPDGLYAEVFRACEDSISR